MKMVVEMINPKMDERVLDSSCGTGGFLVTAMTHVIADLEREFFLRKLAVINVIGMVISI